jgi:hypothetical protein
MEDIMRKLLHVVLVGCVLAVAGCGGESGTAEKSEQIGEQPQKLGCECSGYWYCPDPYVEYWYDPPGCGYWTAVSAGNACNTNCSYPCVNAGWQC